MGKGSVETRGFEHIKSVQSLYVSGNLAVSSSIFVGQPIINNKTDLILTSSLTSKITVSGNLDVLGNITATTGLGRVTGSDDFFVNRTLDVFGQINNVSGSLYLTSSAESTIVISGALNVLGKSTGSMMDIQYVVVPNSEKPTPTNVGAYAVFKTPHPALAPETTAIYIKNTPRVATNDLNYAIYGEVSDDQSLVGGAFSKVIHRGLGDAHYVALFATGGFGYEAAMFRDSENGYIATWQGSGGFQESVPYQPNCIGFQALQTDDRKNPGWVPNYGLFLAVNSTGHALTVRSSEFADPGQAQIRICDNHYINRWAAYTSGETHLISCTASAVDTLYDSPQLALVGHFWETGSSYQARSLIKSHTKNKQAELYFQLGEYGTETTAIILTTASLDLQGHEIATVSKLAFTSGTTGIDLQTVSIVNAGNITFYDGTKNLDLQNSQIINCGKLTMQLGGSGIDVQTAPFFSIGNMGFYSDNIYDVGAFNTTRPRNIYAASAFIVGSTGSITANEGNLILSSSNSSLVAISSSLQFPNTDKQYHINAPNSCLILSSSAGCISLSSSMKIHNIPEAKMGHVTAVNDNLILSSSAGSLIVASGSFYPTQIYRAPKLATGAAGHLGTGTQAGFGCHSSIGDAFIGENDSPYIQVLFRRNEGFRITGNRQIGWTINNADPSTVISDLILKRYTAHATFQISSPSGSIELSASVPGKCLLYAMNSDLILSSSTTSLVTLSSSLKLFNITSASLPTGDIPQYSGAMVWVSDTKHAAIYGPEGWTRIMTGGF